MKSRTLLLIAGALVLLIILLQPSVPAQPDWSPSFEADARSPFGTWITRDIVERLFPSASISETERSFFNEIEGGGSGRLLIAINDSLAPDPVNASSLLDFVARGNSALLSADRLGDEIADTLGLVVLTTWFDGPSNGMRFVNPALPRGVYEFERERVHAAFDPRSLDTSRTRVLAVDDRGEPTFVRVAHGRGMFYVNLFPYAYTNYFARTDSGAAFVAASLSHLPETGAIIWDEYYKSGRHRSGSVLGVVLSEAPLRWGLYTTIVGGLLFMIFQGRRRQRVIPVVVPPANATLEFVDTVARLYLRHGDHRDLAEKQVTYLMEEIRSRYGVNTASRSVETRRILAARSGATAGEVDELFDVVDTTLRLPRLGNDELSHLHRTIESFRRTMRRSA